MELWLHRGNFFIFRRCKLQYIRIKNMTSATYMQIVQQKTEKGEKCKLNINN